MSAIDRKTALADIFAGLGKFEKEYPGYLHGSARQTVQQTLRISKVKS